MRSALRSGGQRVRYAAVAVAAHHLGDHHLVALEPARLLLLGFEVRRVAHQLLQRLPGLPVVDVGDQACGGVLPGLFAQVAGDGAGDLGDPAVRAWNCASYSPGAKVKVDVYIGGWQSV